ncbi:MAG: hypothetical protein WC554_00955 [Clostridia bacterium]|jgi:hypothetical protein
MAKTHAKRTLSIYRQEAKEGFIEERELGEETGQTYKAGAPLVYDGGEIEVWAGGTDATEIVGVAVKDATGTAGSSVPYYEANDYNLFEGTLINNTTDYVLLGSEIGKGYSLIASGNNWYIDIADETTKKVEVVGLVSAVGDTNPRVIFRFLGGMQSRVLQS